MKHIQPPDEKVKRLFRCIHFPMYLSAADSTLMQNRISCVNVISEGSHSRILIVLRISFGMTTRPRSSILLTIPVAFILCLLLCFAILDSFAFSKLPVLFAHQGNLCMKKILAVCIVYRQSTQICVRDFSAAVCIKTSSK